MNDYGPEPSTLEEWMAMQTCCCDMPDCPAPSIDCEQKSLSFNICGYKNETDCKIYQTETYNITGSFTEGSPSDPPVVAESANITRNISYDSIVGPCTTTCTITGSATEEFSSYTKNDDNPTTVITRSQITTLSADAGGDCMVLSEYDDTHYQWSCPVDQTQPCVQGPVDYVNSSSTLLPFSAVIDELDDPYYVHSESYSNPYTNTQVQSAAETAVALEPWVSGTCQAIYSAPELDTPSPSSPPCESDLVNIKELRYRWTVPANHTGTYFLIEWDEAFTDTDGNITLTPKSWEWNDPDDKTSDWSLSVLVPSGFQGTVEIANVFYKCYDGPYGSLPQHDTNFPTRVATA